MNTETSPRKRRLLTAAVLLLLLAAYLLAFRIPLQQKMERLQQQSAAAREELAECRLQLAGQERMERELEGILAEYPGPKAMPRYDNTGNVLIQLSRALESSASEYSVSFGEADPGAEVVQRNVSLRFSAEDYESARAILQALHDGEYRCRLGDLELDLSPYREGVGVSVQLTYYEYNGT